MVRWRRPARPLPPPAPRSAARSTAPPTRSGCRIVIKGALAPAGQPFTTTSATLGGSLYSAANGQLLSTLGTVVPVDLGAGQDLFFLSFDQLDRKSVV